MVYWDSNNNSPLAQFLQFIEAWRAFCYVLEQMREFSDRWQADQFCQGFAAWTADAIRIRKIPMHNSFECLNQIFFRVHKRAFE
jgi:hypothetical protein